MKEGWERKKLGEFITEYSVRNKKDIDYPVYSVTNSQGFCRDYFSKEVASQNKTTYKIVPRGYFAYNPSRINVGSVDWQREEDNVIVSPLYVVFRVSELLRQDYLQYYLRSKATIKLIGAIATGTVRANLKFNILSSFEIPVPPLAEQEKIVAELDCLSGIIEKKKQQLKEYDALAQSIFYEMFGDPITNEKNWEMKNLGEIATEIFAGGDKPKDISSIKTDEYAYPVYANGDGDRGLLGFSKNYRVENKAVTIGARGASVGNCRICNEKFTPVVRLITIVPSGNIDIIFLYHYVQQIEWDVNGAGQAQLTTPNVVNKKIYLPPHTLQQQFASKIEAIEKQKALIKKSIEEVETLFNSKMNYYFN